MIKIGFTIESYEGLEPSFLLNILRYFGVEYIEMTKTVFKEVDKVSQQMNSIVAGFHLPLVHEDGWDFSCPDYQHEINDLIVKINKYRDDLHIMHCIAHPPEPWNMGSPRNTSFDLLLHNLNRLDVPVFLENVPHGNQKDYLNMYERAKSRLETKFLGMCFDAAHYFVSGEDPLKHLSELNGKIGCVHLSDCAYDNDSHLPFDVGGVLPIEKILIQLKKNHYHGYLNLEIRPRSLNDLEAVIDSYLKTLKFLKKWKYLRTRFRLLFFKSLIHRFLNRKRKDM